MNPADLVVPLVLGIFITIAGGAAYEAGRKFVAYFVWALAGAFLGPALFWIWMLAFGGMLGR